MTLHQHLRLARARLEASGISPSEAAVDVDVLARHVLGWDRATLLVESNRPVPHVLEPALSALVARRERREPTAYIVGVREFWGREFVVTPQVLIPRPETELIIEECLRIADAGDAPPARVADVGTGSGCLAVTLACEWPGARVVGTDVSAAALDVARENTRRHGVEGRVDLVASPYLDAVRGPFDLLVANPPYVREEDGAGLSREVRHEPDVALFGGPGGLRDLAGVLRTAVDAVRRGGWVVIEYGFDQEDAVARLVSQQPGLALDRMRQDLQGLPRTAIIERV